MLPFPSRSRDVRVGVRYRDRRTREILVEEVPAERAMHWFYGARAGGLLHGLVFSNGVFSRLYGWWQNRSWTRRRIRPFVERFQIDVDEVEDALDQYPTFNAFFSRRLRADARPFAADPEVLCSPADGRVLVYPFLSADLQFPLKGGSVTPSSLLDSEETGRFYEGGSALVVRLAPSDYHRFHFFDDALAGPARLVRGKYHSVNPIALRRLPDLFHLNQRAVTEVESANFGRVAQVEIGAFAVGSIVQTYAPGPVRRGEEKGYFQFGGSTLVLLFPPESVCFDEDLVRDSAAGLEVQVRAGEGVGRAGRPPTGDGAFG